jgi:hypothetical protein
MLIVCYGIINLDGHIIYMIRMLFGKHGFEDLL